MKNTQQIIETIIELARDYAALQVHHIKSEQELLLFGISIGIGRRLTNSECRSYLRTFFTAEAILGYERSLLRPEGHRRLHSVTLALRCWLQRERWLRPELETRFGYAFGPPYYPLYLIEGPIHGIFIKHIRALAKECVPPLREEEIQAFIHQLEHPLPRSMRQ